MDVRTRVVVELSVVAGVTTVFLTLIPERPPGVDLALAMLGFSAVAATAKETRERIWGPPPAARRARLQHSWRHLLIGTAAVTAACAAVGGASRGAGSLVQPALGVTLALFIPWALVQQTLFQFYLLGRLRVALAPAPSAALTGLNGLLFGLVHLPDWGVAIAAAAAGGVWSWYYLRDRCLAPIAVSHAIAGTAYLSWVLGRDLALEWLELPGG